MLPVWQHAAKESDEIARTYDDIGVVGLQKRKVAFPRQMA
jgi:hypothetical protein